jgi:microcystin-dependent protein
VGTKKITDLQLIGAVTDDLNFPGDNGSATYRATAEQIKNYVLDTDNVQTAAIKDENVTRSKVVSTERIPVGAVMPFAGSAAPAGFLLCDGSAINRTTYADLFAILNITHGQGNGSTTFNIPDYRGRFLRGVDSGIARDPDRESRTAMATGGNAGDAVGSIQTQATKAPGTSFTSGAGSAHTHLIVKDVTLSSQASVTASNYVARAYSSGSDSANYVLSGQASAADAGKTSSESSHTHSITGGGDSETRPINAGVNYIIKY